MKIIFMGTPDFSVNTLDALVSAGHNVVLVVSQPDKPKGRSKEPQFSPVKRAAIKYSLPVYQPTSLRTEEAVKYLRACKADIMVVVAFGQILPKVVLEMTTYGCINVHASLLPAYRGAAPIQWPIINGDKKTGVTIIQMDEGIDTGDMILKEEIPINDQETASTLHDELAKLGAKLCVKALKQIEDNTVIYQPQQETTTSYAKMLTKEMGRISWSKSAVEIERLVRGLNPWPGVYTFLDGKELKVWKARIVDCDCGQCQEWSIQDNYQIGAVVHVGNDKLVIKTGNGLLELLEIQLSGKKRMEIDAFLRGNKINPGTVLD